MISDTFEGVPWRYTDPAGLIDILCEKVDQGFTFPLNPKWILCDPGWRRVYDKLIASNKPNVGNSLKVWFPREIRQRIDAISAEFPEGFVSCTSSVEGLSNSVQVELAMLELKRFEVRRFPVDTC